MMRSWDGLTGTLLMSLSCLEGRSQAGREVHGLMGQLNFS